MIDKINDERAETIEFGSEVRGNLRLYNPPHKNTCLGRTISDAIYLHACYTGDGYH